MSGLNFKGSEVSEVKCPYRQQLHFFIDPETQLQETPTALAFCNQYSDPEYYCAAQRTLCGPSRKKVEVVLDGGKRSVRLKMVDETDYPAYRERGLHLDRIEPSKN